MRILLHLLISVMPFTAFAGGVVGNGGDSIVCLKLGTNVPVLLNLDYLLAVENGKTPAPMLSWELSRQRLLGILKANAPELVDSFESFSSSVLGENKFSRPTRTWHILPSDPIRPGQTVPRERLPRECAEAFIAEFRMVTRYYDETAGHITYKYSELIHLPEAGETWQVWQFSFLMIHEWLRDFTQDLGQIHSADAFLHSLEIGTLTRDQVRQRLQTFGLL
ncbi:MAG: hypothetical protein ACXWQE_02995 [Bdellovibrionales bacterium]